jgi:acetylglutamate kinase
MNETVMKILKSFGLDKEMALYLQAFQKTPVGKFAVIKISGRVLQEKMPMVAEDLAFLSQLGLSPIVIHDADNAADAEGRKGDVQKASNALTSKLVSMINEKGGRAINANGMNIVEVERKPSGDVTGPDFVGKVKRIKKDKIFKVCKAGYVPVLASLGYENDVAYGINADTLASWLVKMTRPKKFILVTESGGVLDKNGGVISTIDIHADLPDLIGQDMITGGMLPKVQEIETLLDSNPTMVVEVCSAENILQELFTIKGSGTFIRHGGNLIVRKSFRGLNIGKIKKLLTESFGKSLVPEYFDDPVDCVVVDRDYNGLMVIKRVGGVPYLDKFAVAKSAQGNGLGKTMWYFIKKRYDTLIWRSAPSNQIDSWYLKNCDGMQKSGPWIIFWYNLDRSRAIKLIPIISRMKRTLVEIDLPNLSN